MLRRLGKNPLKFLDVVKAHIRIFDTMMTKKEIFGKLRITSDYSIAIIDLTDSTNFTEKPVFNIDFLNIFN